MKTSFNKFAAWPMAALLSLLVCCSTRNDGRSLVYADPGRGSTPEATEPVLSRPEIRVQTDMDGSKWAMVAGVAGSDQETQGYVHDALARKGIVCMMEGSMGYSVLVPLDRLAEARRILRRDPNLKDRLAIVTGISHEDKTSHWKYSGPANSRLFLF